MNIIEKLRKVMCAVLSLCIVVFACFCVAKRASVCTEFQSDFAVVAALFNMPDANLKQKPQEKTKQKSSVTLNKSTSGDASKEKKVAEQAHSKNEPTYPVREVDLSSDTTLYDNISLNNSTPYMVEASQLLEQGLPFEVKDSHSAQVLIVHTHTCESYLENDDGYYYESYYPRTTDNEKNVYAVGEAIAESLKANSIGVVHASDQHDYPSYDGAYDRSYETIQQYLAKYKDIKVVLDIHRDSMTQQDNTRLKPTFTYNGQKAAQIMIMTGYDATYTDFPMWEENLRFALNLQNTCETMYDGMTRPLNFGDFTYNMNVNSGSLLIEVGTDANTLSEAVLSGKLLGNALSQVLQKS